MKRLLVAASLLLAFSAAFADPQTTAFTYQGNLTANGAPANGSFNLTFTLYDAATAGNAIGTPITLSNFPIVNGRFTTDLDFPGAFGTEQRWIEVNVGGQALSPRQPVNAAPVAQFALSTGSPNHVVVVAGPDSAANGAKLVAAFSGIATQAPSASNPFVVTLEPGVYDIAASPLQLLPYVDLEGSGEGVTLISGAGQASTASGVVLAANAVQLRRLTIQSRSGSTYSAGVYADGSITSTFRLDHVTVQAADGTAYGTGINLDGASPWIENTTVVVANTTTNGQSLGISSKSGAPQIKNSTIQVRSSGTGTATGISTTSSATPLIDHVAIAVSTSGAPAGSVSPDAVGLAVNFAATVVQNSNITATTTGGGSGVGVTLNNSTINPNTVTLENTDITATTTGASFAQGILNNTGGNNPMSLLVRNSSITVSGTNKTNCQAFGIDSFGAPVAAFGNTVNVSVGTGCLAGVGLILQGGPNDLTFNNGYVKSTQYAIYNGSGTSKVRVGASQLSAPTSSSGGAACINTFKSDYATPTTATCG